MSLPVSADASGIATDTSTLGGISGTDDVTVTQPALPFIRPSPSRRRSRPGRTTALPSLPDRDVCGRLDSDRDASRRLRQQPFGRRKRDVRPSIAPRAAGQSRLDQPYHTLRLGRQAREPVPGESRSRARRGSKPAKRWALVPFADLGGGTRHYDFRSDGVSSRTPGSGSHRSGSRSARKAVWRAVQLLVPAPRGAPIADPVVWGSKVDPGPAGAAPRWARSTRQDGAMASTTPERPLPRR
jgi:hypothetical protein